MRFGRFTFASVLLLLGCCFSQDRGGTDPKVALPLIREVLSKAQVSGSLAYWGQCDWHRSYPDFPVLRAATHSGSPTEVLQDMFAADPDMRVTQENGGKIRMVEKDAPTDLLEVKIHHLSFPTGLMHHGPHTALQTILMTPEVIAFRRAHSIGPLAELTRGFPVPGDCCGGPSVSGDLDDVTVAQALDYVLQTFPGFWLYENCQDTRGERTVVFNFFGNDPFFRRTQR